MPKSIDSKFVHKNTWAKSPLGRLGCFAAMLVAPCIPLTCALNDFKKEKQREQLIDKLHKGMTPEEIAQIRPEIQKAIKNPKLGEEEKAFLLSVLDDNKASIWGLSNLNPREQFKRNILPYAEEISRLRTKYNLNLDYNKMPSATEHYYNNRAMLFFNIYQAFNHYDFALEQNKKEPGFISEEELKELKRLVESITWDNAKMTIEKIEQIVFKTEATWVALETFNKNNPEFPSIKSLAPLQYLLERTK